MLVEILFERFHITGQLARFDEWILRAPQSNDKRRSSSLRPARVLQDVAAI
jgi:hypothetical protein